MAALEPAWAKGKSMDPAVPMLTWQRVHGPGARLRNPALTLVAGDMAMDADKGNPARGTAFMEMAAEAANLVPGIHGGPPRATTTCATTDGTA